MKGDPAKPGSGAVAQPVSAGQPVASSNASERSPFSPPAKENLNVASTAQPEKKPGRPSIPVVDGFTRKNIPELLRVADVATRRGDYRLAKYEYNLILRLDPNNATARSGLRLVRSSEHLR